MKIVALMTKEFRRNLLACVAAGALAANSVAPALAQTSAKTPIKHVILIIGENRTFDHVFATYRPVNRGETVWNLLSEHIVNADGSPGANYAKARQYQGDDSKIYQLTPPKTPYAVLPPALVGGPSTPYVCQLLKPPITTGTSCPATPANLAQARAIENGLAPTYVQYLLTGGTGQTARTPDQRIEYDGQGPTTLPPGPFQITGPKHPYDAYDASPVHRFFQMRQQLDCGAASATTDNPSGCLADLFPWVEVSVGAGSNGAAPPAPFTPESTGEGATAMGFYNVQSGDASYLKSLADTYSMSDNYHQGVMGGTGANHIMLGYGFGIWYSNGAGTPETPPHVRVDPAMPGTPPAGATNALSQIENPDPQPGTNNWYTQDGYGGGSGSPAALPPKANYGGGSYVDCDNTNQPGVQAVRNYLNALATKIDPKCKAGQYYLVNNYNPGYFGDGRNAFTDKNPNNYVFTIPPSNVPNIDEDLTNNKITWAYYGDQFDRYLADPYDLSPINQYCNICNWAQYSTQIMTNAAVRTAHLKDTTDLYAAIANNTLPAVSFVKPSGFVDGHPASSKLILFEGFVKKIVDAVKANPSLWSDTAIMITMDEGGGYWDTGYVQPLDFFGDGTRIPMIVVSSYSVGGHISHTYTDHVSVTKFIEANWGLPPITPTGRDALPNPTVGPTPYVPGNSPAIGDLMDMFSFTTK
ncbi:phospholipase C [Roseiarcus fermentans]|uniref:Phospholipase C n=1 Tax=Roseiarcus fermentans TaxID=1473586 RepID=A0A366ESI6_9HYPH|nr:alkaline phosphatase family protein [Roseiarcus fermentans]RBP04650.1 phospholipase C [Roseiarcus fermentans]